MKYLSTNYVITTIMNNNLTSRIWILGLLLSATANLCAKTTTYTFSVKRLYNAAHFTQCDVSTVSARRVLGKDVNAASFNSGDLKLFAIQPSGNAAAINVSDTTWYSKSNVRTTKTANFCTGLKFNYSHFLIGHNTSNAAADGEYSVAMAIVNPTMRDTLVYQFNLTFSDVESVTDNQPETTTIRPDVTESWVISTFTQRNQQTPKQQNYIQVWAGEDITLTAEPKDASLYTDCKYQWGRYEWNAKTKKYTEKALSKYIDTPMTLTQVQVSDGGRYFVKTRLKTPSGSYVARTYDLYVDVQEDTEYHTWAEHPLTYNFRTEYPTLQKPEKMHNIKKKNGSPANSYAGEWWSAFWGDDLNSACGSKAQAQAAAKNMVEQYDYDFAYIRDYMGWPPDLSARKGYKSFVYIFGSGLANDNESKDTQGGYQSSTYADGQNWACVWASYYPFSRFRDDADQLWSDGEYQRNAMIHEGIHATFADLGACQGSSWFHEGGNTWLQGQVYARRDGVHGDAGFLDGGPFLAPHMPIECYSGWLQDGSYGGPAAQGVNMYNSSGNQVCTWRTYLGGVQYANAFPTVIANVCGDGSIPWIWRYCKNRVLETMGDTLGNDAMREVILQYRARQALFDLGGWDKSYRAVTNSYFGTTIKAEWSPFWINVAAFKLTPYQSVTLNDDEGWMAPDTLTNPGWSGANFIPIHINPDGDFVQVEFRPEDTNLMALLCYRSKEGLCYYGHPVNCGTMTISLEGKPANGVVFCVVANTDYIYTGDEQRKHHWDYRLKFVKNANQIADTYQRWYFYEQNIKDPNYDATAIKSIEDSKEGDEAEGRNVKILSGFIHVGDRILLDLDGIDHEDVTVRMVGITGTVIKSGRISSDGTFQLPDNIPAGLYVLTFTHQGKRDVVKVIIK